MALEEVGDEDTVGSLFVAVCENIGALEGLWEEAEDVVDEQDGVFGILGACGVRLQAFNCDLW